MVQKRSYDESPGAFKVPATETTSHAGLLTPDAVRKRKRKLDQYTRPLVDQQLCLHRTPYSKSAEPLHATVQSVIPRAYLPLSALDPYHDSQPSVPRYVLTKDITLGPGKNVLGPDILLVAINGHGSLFALEHYNQSVYTLSRLVSGLKIEDLERSQQSRQLPTHLGAQRPQSASWLSDQWWRDALIPHDLSLMTFKRRSVDAPLLQPPDSHRRATIQVEAPNTLATECIYPTAPPNHPPDDAIAATVEAPPNMEQQDALEALVAQYLDTLYLSKTSLAYFAKSTLARARAKFTTTPEASPDIGELRDFLQTMVLGANLEKKYKETLPEIISQLKPTNAAGIEQPSRSRKRKAKKQLKPGKGGIYGHEQDFASKWWLSDEFDGTETVSGDRQAVIKSSLARLRLREVMLQVILILETMALQPTVKKVDLLECSSSAKNEDSADARKKTKQAEKKSVELKSALQRLIDWLSIWQSLNALETSPASKGKVDQHSGAVGGLKEFCTEVIAPFFASRVPLVTKDVCKQIGVPLHSSPSRNRNRKILGKTNNKSAAKDFPHDRLDIHKPVQECLTDKTNTYGQLPASLKRASTDSAILPPSRSERSSTPQSLIQSEKRERTLSRSNSVALGKSRFQREVDMGAITKARNSKSKKDPQVEQELKDAIAALKKPNRTLVAKEYFEEADKHMSSTLVTKKSQTALQRPHIGVLVGATPKRSNKTKLLGESTPRRLQPEKIGEIQDSVPSSNPFIPSSTAKPRWGNIASIPDSSPGYGNSTTPSKLQPINFGSLPVGVGTDSNRLPKRFEFTGVAKGFDHSSAEARLQTPLKGSGEVGPFASSSPFTLAETPMKSHSSNVTSAVNSKAVHVVHGQQSIYEALGWEDELG